MADLYKAHFDDFTLNRTIDDQPQQKGFRMHLHDHLEIYLFISGKAKYVVEGNEYELSPGNLLLLRDSESHCINFLSDSPYERYVLYLRPSFIKAVDPDLRLLKPFYDRPLGTDNMYRPSELPGISALSYFKAMCIEANDTYDTRLAVMTNLLPLLRDVGTAFQKRKEPDLHSSIAGQITAYINEHLFEDISVLTIANQFFMSVSQIERIFKKYMHSSVWQYINAKRLAAARRKIESGISAYTACEESAFGDYSSFYRAYVKAYGEKPSAYKKPR
jgi:AraC-like DNA-binding protein